jgi:hypothetical protein
MTLVSSQHCLVPPTRSLWVPLMRTLLVVIALTGLSGCYTESPATGHIPVSLDDSAFAGQAKCAPVSGGADACPGTGCSQNIVGAVDGQILDLAACTTVDLAFIGGALRARLGQADLAFHLGSLAGRTRIEVSEYGQVYELAAYINSSEGSVPDRCLAEISGNTATVDLGQCNVAYNIAFVRITPDRNYSGRLTVDAVEGLSFVARQ